MRESQKGAVAAVAVVGIVTAAWLGLRAPSKKKKKKSTDTKTPSEVQEHIVPGGTLELSYDKFLSAPRVIYLRIPVQSRDVIGNIMRVQVESSLTAPLDDVVAPKGSGFYAFGVYPVGPVVRGSEIAARLDLDISDAGPGVDSPVVATLELEVFSDQIDAGEVTSYMVRLTVKEVAYDFHINITP